MGFKEIASPMAAMGVPTTPVLPNSKKAFMPDWPTSATIDLAKIEEWDKMFPGYNGAAVATGKPDGVWFFEVDSPEVIQRIQAETNQQIPDTFRVRSRPGRGHFYFRQTPASLAMGNISQTYVKGGDWSARVENQYVVAAGSIHPHSQQPYVALRDEPIIPAPDWLIEWLISQKVEKRIAEPVAEIRDAHGLIPHGSIHGYMLTQAGRLRRMGLDVPGIETALLELVHKNCAPPIDDSKVRAMARSVEKYEPAPPMNGEIQFTQQTSPAINVEEPEELPTFGDEPYPTFPSYVMEGTSLYENFVKPVCDHNSRIPYFMWLPAMAMLLNYIGPKIKLKAIGGTQPFKGGIYEVLIGKAGKANKSSCVNDAKNYFNYMGCMVRYSGDVKNAEGRTLTTTVGSAEGLGMQMQKSNSKNMLLDYDELSNLVSKVGIESSSLASALLLLYEGNDFSNGVKGGKESYSVASNSYCVSMIACTTTNKFAELWSRLAGSDTGLDDRFMFILEPEILPTPTLFKYINTIDGAVKTLQLIRKAQTQEVYDFETPDHPRLRELNDIANRYALRAERWAVGLAIDLGLDVVDDECVERACDIVKYEIAVKNFLKSYQANTREGEIQLAIHRILEMSRGRIKKQDLKRRMQAARYGTSLFNQAYKGLLSDGVFREEGTGTRSDPTILQLLRKRDVFDE